LKLAQEEEEGKGTLCINDLTVQRENIRKIHSSRFELVIDLHISFFFFFLFFFFLERFEKLSI